MSAPVVIVGAGSSGAVLANRLSASGRREVVLVEAGPDYLPEALPADLANGHYNSMKAHDWGYTHRPSRRAARFPLPRGRVVGGSSAVNTCIALRGQPEDFDEWAALGLEGWSWGDCLPAFRRLERDLDFPNAPHHGADGPLPVRRSPPAELEPYQLAFLEACAQLGYPACPDANAPGAVGAGPHAMNKVAGRRISAAEAYLTREVRARGNLTLRPDCLVRRVRMEGARATGVELETAGGGVEVLEASHVVLCAGALNTPGVLLRSGIGPDRELRRLGVSPVVDAPAVARRLLDHPGMGIFVWARRGVTVDRKVPILQTVLRFASGELDHPADMLLQPASFTMLANSRRLFALVGQVGKPRGTGELHYPSADPRAKPQVRSRFFENAWDRKLALDALDRAFELLMTPEMQRMGTPALPPAPLLRRRTLLERCLPLLCDSGYHPCGTVPMGPAPGPEAATDARGRVFGAQGLSVVDASLMPTIPSSNIHLPTLMMAERLAEQLDVDL